MLAVRTLWPFEGRAAQLAAIRSALSTGGARPRRAGWSSARWGSRVLAGALGGQIEGPTVQRLWRVSDGNVLFLRELVLAGEASEALGERHGVWRWQGEISVTTRLRELVEGRIGEITAAERAALEFVSYGEPLAAALLTGLVPMETVRRLENRELVTVSPEDFSVRLAHPLYGEPSGSAGPRSPPEAGSPRASCWRACSPTPTGTTRPRRCWSTSPPSRWTT
jgi:hypothetical protein